MATSNTTISRLRQRFIDDMSLRKLAPKTQSGYIRAVKNLARFLGRSPYTATPEDLRRFQLQMVADGVSRITLNATITALRFFFEVTLDRVGAIRLMSHVRVHRKLPVILSADEVTRLIDAATSPKYKAVLAVAYGAGLRISEVVALKISDIDGQRKILRVEEGKGGKDRFAMLSTVLLSLLRDWWRIAPPNPHRSIAIANPSFEPRGFLPRVFSDTCPLKLLGGGLRLAAAGRYPRTLNNGSLKVPPRFMKY